MKSGAKQFCLLALLTVVFTISLTFASDRSAAALTRALEDEDFEVRIYAMEALRMIRKKD